MNVSEVLVANWILAEAVANDIVDRTEGGHIFRGNTNDYIIEIKAFQVPKGEA